MFVRVFFELCLFDFQQFKKW